MYVYIYVYRIEREGEREMYVRYPLRNVRAPFGDRRRIRSSTTPFPGNEESVSRNCLLVIPSTSSRSNSENDPRNDATGSRRRMSYDSISYPEKYSHVVFVLLSGRTELRS